jgi:hypothetical protein
VGREIAAKLSEAQDTSHWLATVRPDGRPHQRPIWAEWVAGSLYFACGNTVKGRHLARDTRCSVSMHIQGVDLVIEGNARQVTDETELLRVRDTYAAKGWTTLAGAAVPRRWLHPGHRRHGRARRLPRRRRRARGGPGLTASGRAPACVSGTGVRILRQGAERRGAGGPGAAGQVAARLISRRTGPPPPHAPAGVARRRRSRTG